MLSAVTDMSYGILSIVPKYADGTPITDFEDVIITENGRELKAWDSIARYMASFADTDGDGIANVPAYYSTTHGRKLVDTSRSPLALLKNPNKFTAVYAGLLAVAVLLIVLVVGSSVNGASRWIALGPLRIQPAEFTKLSLFCYIANYLVRKADEVRNNLRGFLKPMGVILVLAVLLLAAAYAVVSGMVKRQLTQTEERP